MPRETITDFAIERLAILAPDGSVDEALEPHLTPEQLLRLYRAMLLARAADEKALKLQRQGRIGTFPPCTGQEAAHCAPALAMTGKDWYLCAFRELGGMLMRGVPLDRYYLLYRGFEEGNVFPEGSRTLPVSIPIATQTLHAAGLAYGMRYKGELDSAAVAFFGDGATSEGDFHEALNFAGLWKAPAVFICQNNHWAISMPRAKQTSSRTLAQKALAYDIRGVQVDGNDPLAMYAATREALDRAYAGEGPTLIEAVTYRLLMHTTADDPTKYRSDDEVAAWWDRDPLKRFRIYLDNKGLWSPQQQEELDAEVKAEVERAVAAFEAAVERLPPDAPFDHVFGEPQAYIEEQRREFLAELELERARPEAAHG